MLRCEDCGDRLDEDGECEFCLKRYQEAILEEQYAAEQEEDTQ